MIQTAQHNPDERAARLRAWAMATAAAPDDRTIVIPAEFNREEAFLALELALYDGAWRPADADASGVRLGQGRDTTTEPPLAVPLVVLALLALACAAAVTSCALGA